MRNRSRRSLARSALVVGALLVLTGCQKKLDGPQPAVDGVSPQLACGAQVLTEISISGDALSPLNDRLLTGKDLELPQVVLTREVDLAGTASDESVTVPDDPASPAQSDTRWKSQQAMSFFVCPQGTCSSATPARTDYELAPGLYGVTVTNRSGRSASFGSALTIVPPPVLASISSDLFCQDQENTLELRGDYFLRVNGMPFTVTVGTQSFSPSELFECRALPSAAGFVVESCRRAQVRIAAKTFTRGTFPVRIVGPAPAGCSSTEPLTVTFVPEPGLTTAEPDVACVAEMTRSITLRGRDFLTVDAALPLVHVGAAQFTPTSATDCVAVTGPTETVRSCATLTLTIPVDRLPAGLQPVVVTNPAPADCTSRPPVNLAIVDPPSLLTVQPDLACNERAVSAFTLVGTGFLGIGAEVPTVTLSGPAGVTYTSVAADVTLTTATCAPLTGVTESIRRCTELVVRVPQGRLSASGAYAFTVTNPAPAGCSSSRPVSATLVPAPTLTAIGPARVCSAQGILNLVATGTGFLTVGGVTPHATFAGPGAPLTVSAGIIASGCTAVAGTSLAVQSCTSLSIPSPQGAFTVGAAYAVTITNPDPAACSSVENVSVTGTSPPTITSVAPLTICAGGGLLNITGSGMEADAGVSVGTQAAGSVTVTALADGGTLAQASFGAGAIGGPFAVTLTNPSGCSATTAPQVNITQGPLLVFVEPRVAWNGMNTPTTVYGSGVVNPVRVELVLTGTNDVPMSLAFTPAPGHPDRPIATVPKNTPVGVYDVLLTDAAGCPARLVAALTVTASTTLTLTSVSPRFGWTGSTTDVTVNASGAGFGPLPLVYLTPTTTQSSVIKLGSVAVLSPTGLATQVPSGLPAGSYDLVVVNQDGTVGVRSAAFTVNLQPPPTVNAVTPANVSSGVTSQALTIQGANFRVPAGPRPSVVFRCLSPLGIALPNQTLTVGSVTGTSISATVNTTLYPAGANCVVEVTNSDDLSTAEFSSVVVVNSSANLTGFAAGPNLAVARRGLGAAAGSFSQSARFVYAIAGDDGVSTLSSVEVLPVDIFGTAGPAFFTQRYGLSTPRTQTSAVRVGRFLYVVGGSAILDANATALDTVERATLLDPSTAPRNLSIDLDVVPATQGGLSGGTFYYRVAAVMGAGDAFNPGGEGLPSDVFGLTLPPLTGYRVQVKLTWDPVPGAAGYEIYRTAANGIAGSETLIADVPTTPATISCSGPTSCTDKGATELLAVSPLRPGSTGRWTALPQRLTIPRIGPGVTWAADPVLAPDGGIDKAHVYVFGGLDDGGVAQTSYERLTLTINANGSQTVAAAITGATPLSAGRWRTRGFTAGPKDTTFVGPNSYVWVGPGSAANPSTTIATMEGAQVLPGGALGPFTVSTVPGHAGYGAFAAGDFLYALGGANGLPSVETVTAELVAAPAPPSFGNVQSFTPGLRVPRVDLGATLQSGYFYSLGGTTTGGAVTSSTEFVLY